MPSARECLEDYITMEIRKGLFLALFAVISFQSDSSYASKRFIEEYSSGHHDEGQITGNSYDEMNNLRVEKKYDQGTQENKSSTNHPVLDGVAIDELFAPPQNEELLIAGLKSANSNVRTSKPSAADVMTRLMDGVSKEDLFGDRDFLARRDAAITEDSSPVKKTKTTSLKDLEAYGCTYLSKVDEHQSHLIRSIRQARKSILITSWACYANSRNCPQVINELKERAERGITIYLYFYKGKEIKALQGPYQRFVKQNRLNIHAKILLIDDSNLTIGSYDWLQNPNYGSPSENESIVLDPRYSDLNTDIWNAIRSYRALSDNPDEVYSFEDRFNGLAPLSLTRHDNTHQLTLLTTPQMHRDEIQNVWHYAKDRIIMSVFCVTKCRDLLADFLPLDWLQGYLTSGRRLAICYNIDENLGSRCLFEHLGDLIRKFHGLLQLIPTPNLHQKTLIVDDDTYMIGSYNLLSSADTLMDPHTYMETSLLIRGDVAKILVRNFEGIYLKRT